MKMAHSPPGHHSVIGRPSTGGLSFAEYVVYRGEQVMFFRARLCMLIRICILREVVRREIVFEVVRKEEMEKGINE